MRGGRCLSIPALLWVIAAGLGATLAMSGRASIGMVVAVSAHSVLAYRHVRRCAAASEQHELPSPVVVEESEGLPMEQAVAGTEKPDDRADGTFVARVEALARQLADRVRDAQITLARRQDHRVSAGEVIGAAATEIAAASRELDAARLLSFQILGQVQALGESSQEISAVVESIRTIAAQTNLLALNATIEAARAGDAGRGFAVVAGEVRSLAQAARSATETIDGIVGDLREMTDATVDAAQTTSSQVEASAQRMQGVITRLSDADVAAMGAVEWDDVAAHLSDLESIASALLPDARADLVFSTELLDERTPS